MIEKVLFDYLNQVEAITVPTYTETPENPPASYVVIERTGSREENRHQAITFTVKSIAPSLYAAVTLNENVKAALREMPGAEQDVSGIRIQSDYNSTDTRMKLYRYTTVVVIYSTL